MGQHGVNRSRQRIELLQLVLKVEHLGWVTAVLHAAQQRCFGFIHLQNSLLEHEQDLMIFASEQWSRRFRKSYLFSIISCAT